MSATEDRLPTSGRLRRADATLGAVAWWGLHLAGTYWLVPRTCELSATWPLHLLTVAVLAGILRAGWSAAQLRRSARARPDRHDSRRDLFLGWSGLALAVFFAAVTLAEWSPVLVVDPCW